VPFVRLEGMPKRSACLFAIGLACGALNGCASRPSRGAAVATHDHWLSGYVLGIWGKTELDVRDDCPDTGAASVLVGATWTTLAVTIVTLGMYTPREVRVRCRARP
jgi:hypothetical protein